MEIGQSVKQSFCEQNDKKKMTGLEGPGMPGPEV